MDVFCNEHQTSPFSLTDQSGRFILAFMKRQLFQTPFFCSISSNASSEPSFAMVLQGISQYYLSWSIVTCVGLAPDWTLDTLPIARIKANITGALLGLFCFTLPLRSTHTAVHRVVLTIASCTILRIPTSTRSALAALVIVLLQEGKPCGPTPCSALLQSSGLPGLALTLRSSRKRLLAKKPSRKERGMNITWLFLRNRTPWF
jgi:hypothetical protein